MMKTAVFLAAAPVLLVLAVIALAVAVVIVPGLLVYMPRRPSGARATTGEAAAPDQEL